MKNKTGVLTLNALFTAFSVIFMYIGTVSPRGSAGFMAAASLFTVAAVIQCGRISGICVFAVSSVIGLLLLPDKTPAMFYVLFLGYYPVVKSVCERLEKHVFSWIIKLAVFNAALTAMFFFFRVLLTVGFMEKLTGAGLCAAVYLIFNAVFILYDIGLSRLIGLYMGRIYNKLK